MVRRTLLLVLAALAVAAGCSGGGGGGGGEESPTPTPTPGPSVIDRFPEADASDIARNTTITATFDQDLAPATVESPATGFTAEADGSPVAGTVTYDAGSRTVTLTPDVELPASANVVVSVATSVTNTEGIAVEAPIEWDFATSAILDTVAPTFAGVTGASDGANGSAVLTWVAATDDISSASQIRYRAYLSSNLSTPIITVVGGTSLSTPPYPAGTYEFVVRAADAAGNLETNTATASTSITVPAATFASVQTIFTNRCTNAACHDAVSPQASMNLMSGSAFGATVNVNSTQNAMLVRVKPFDAQNSYLYRKILGQGGISGNRMPPSAALPTGERDTIRNWILNGAPP